MYLSYVARPSLATLEQEDNKIEPIKDEPLGFLGHRIYTVKFFHINTPIAYPISFVLDTSILDFSYRTFNHLYPIITSYLRKKLNIELRTITFEVIPFDDVMEIYPMIDAQYIFMTEEEQNLFLRDIDLNAIYGYRIISDNPISNLVVEKVQPLIDTIKFQDMILCSVINQRYLNEEEIETRIEELSYETELIEEMKIYHISTMDSALYETLLIEFAHAWNFRCDKREDLWFISETPQKKEVNTITKAKKELEPAPINSKSESNISSLYYSGNICTNYRLCQSFDIWVKDSLFNLLQGLPIVVSFQDDISDQERLNETYIRSSQSRTHLKNYSGYTRNKIVTLYVLSFEDVVCIMELYLYNREYKVNIINEEKDLTYWSKYMMETHGHESILSN